MKKEDLSLKLLNAILKEQKKQTKIIQSIKDSLVENEHDTKEEREGPGGNPSNGGTRGGVPSFYGGQKVNEE